MTVEALTRIVVKADGTWMMESCGPEDQSAIMSLTRYGPDRARLPPPLGLPVVTTPWGYFAVGQFRSARVWYPAEGAVPGADGG